MQVARMRMELEPREEENSQDEIDNVKVLKSIQRGKIFTSPLLKAYNQMRAEGKRQNL